MTGPIRNVRPAHANLEDEVRQLRQELAALRQRPLTSAGAFYTESPDGARTFQTGPVVGVAPMPDGTPQWMTILRDINDNWRVALWDPDTTAQGLQQALWEWDHLGNLIRTTDVNGGWAEPHFHFCLHPLFAMAAGTFSYMYTAVNVAEQVLWEGRISWVTHPQISVSGIWGTALGGPNTTRYRLKVNGAVIGTWDVTAVEATTRTFSAIAGAVTFIGAKNVLVELTAQTLSGTGSYGCHVTKSSMVQT